MDSGNSMIIEILENVRKGKSKWNKILNKYLKMIDLTYEKVLEMDRNQIKK